MKQNPFLVSLCVFGLLISGCGSKAEKALEQAISSNSLESMREFYASYGEKLDDNLKAKYSDNYSRLEADSTMYAGVLQATTNLSRFLLAKQYLSENPEGSYIEEIKQIYDENYDQVKDLIKLRDHIIQGFSKYPFIIDATLWQSHIHSFKKSVQDGNYNKVEITEPDDNGHGTFVITYLSYFEDYGSFYVRQRIKGEYTINSDGLIIAEYAVSRLDATIDERIENKTDIDNKDDVWSIERVAKTADKEKARVIFTNMESSDPLNKYRMRVERFGIDNDDCYIYIQPVII